MQEYFMTHTGYDFMYLVSCALNNTVPEKKYLSRMNFEDLYAAIESAINSGEYRNDNSDISKIIDGWKNDKEQAMYKMILMDIERESLTKYMEQEGIWYMPLKGIILKDIYPENVIHQMADNDILFDAKF